MQQPASIPRGFAAATLAVTTVALAATTHARTPPGPAWRAASEYVAMFAPPAHRDAYAAYVTPRPLDEVLRSLAGDPLIIRAPGAWEARALLPLDAFGASGPYDESRLARLYGAQRVRAARGPRGEAGRTSESWLLVSPYPDPGLTRLEPGTLLIVLRVPDL